MRACPRTVAGTLTRITESYAASAPASAGSAPGAMASTWMRASVSTRRTSPAVPATCSTRSTRAGSRTTE